MKLIVGLGNPGEKYEQTRHNMGFRVVDKIADQKNVVMRLENQFKAEKGDFGDMENRYMLAKPQTFMNNSGEAARYLRDYYKLDTEDIWVVHDDVDLEEGVVKIVLGGSSAGHKGVQSIIDNIGTEQFWRIRVGVGRSEKIPTEEWVLMNFEDPEIMAKIIDEVASAIIDSLGTGEGLKSQTIELR